MILLTHTKSGPFALDPSSKKNKSPIIKKGSEVDVDKPSPRRKEKSFSINFARRCTKERPFPSEARVKDTQAHQSPRQAEEVQGADKGPSDPRPKDRAGPKKEEERCFYNNLKGRGKKEDEDSPKVQPEEVQGDMEK